MHLERYICHFDGVLFDVSYFLTTALSLWLFDLTVLLSTNRDGGAYNLDPRHLLNLSKIEQITSGVCKPISSEFWVTLVGFKNAEKVNTSSAFPLLVFSLCTRFIKTIV